MVSSSGPTGLLFATLVTLFQLLLAPLARCDVNVPWTAVPFSPHAYPLAVRSPYLSAWSIPGTKDALNDVWPAFWAGQTLGWAGFVRVDGKTYSFLGASGVQGLVKASQSRAEFTATQSKFSFTAGSVNVNVTFLSPVEPNDLVKQSQPFSYMSVTAVATDGGSHSVQVYSDISAEWVSGDPATPVTWNTTTNQNQAVIHSSKPANPLQFQEKKDQTEYGNVYFSSMPGDGVTYRSGADATVRASFLADGKLDNSQDTNFRNINDQFVVFGIARDLGTVTSTPSSPATFALAHVRDPAVQYVVANNQIESRSLYFWTRFGTIEDALTAFLQEYDAALQRANDFDSKIKSDAEKISKDYSAIVDLSVRQAFAATEITVAKNQDGSWNSGDPLIFMKEISSNGNMNTADVIFPAWPLFLYTNATLGKYLLEPAFRYQATGQYPNKFAIHDLGTHYPNATGHNDGQDENMPLEESGNMLIMALSYAKKTGDNSQLQAYSGLLKQWNEFLVDETRVPGDQLSTDDFLGKQANSTNLAIKGLVGIRAMSEIQSRLGDDGQRSNLTSLADTLTTQVLEQAKAKDGGSHLTLTYGNDSSWGLTYNMYADKLLQTNAFSQEIYQAQTTWYKSLFKPFGIPLDTRSDSTKTDWQIWTAAIATDTETRDYFIKAVRTFAANGLSKQPFGDWYHVTDGKPEGFRARPVVGGHLALLVLDQSQLAKSPGSDSTQTDGGKDLSSTNTSSSSGDSSSTPTTSGATNSPNSAKSSVSSGMLTLTIGTLLGSILSLLA